MTIDFNISSAIVFALIAQGLFACLILLLKKENRDANRYLALLSFTLSLWLVDTFFRTSGMFGQNPDLYFLPIYFSLGFGPLVYLYTKRLTHANSASFWPDAVHFIPVFLQFALYLFLQTKDYSFRRDFWFSIHSPYTYDLELIFSFSSLIIYLVLSRRLIRYYKLRLENSFSSTHQIALRWLNQLHIALSILSLLWIIESIGRLVWGYYPATPFSSISIGIFLLLIGIGAILQKDLTSVTRTLAEDHGEKENRTDNETISHDVIRNIQDVMLDQQLFLHQDLTLAEFAHHVNLTPRDTSRIINQGMGVSFIDFVNRYRVDRFKELLKNEEYGHLSLLGVAYESGFNSKSTFNRVFKKLEGKSPSTYLKT